MTATPSEPQHTARTYVVTVQPQASAQPPPLSSARAGTASSASTSETRTSLPTSAQPTAGTTLAGAVDQASGGRIDAVIAVAGVAAPAPVTITVNYFGAIATLERLRPLLEHSDAPRAAIVSSFSTLQTTDDDVVEACLQGDEAAAVSAAETAVARDGGQTLYASSKRAISRWVRRAAISPEWAGAGIPLNAVGPGVVISPMTQPMLDNPEQRAALLQMVPMPLHGPSEPAAPAELLAWLTSPANTHVTGQVIFVDGGADASLRTGDIFA